MGSRKSGGGQGRGEALKSGEKLARTSLATKNTTQPDALPETPPRGETGVPRGGAGGARRDGCGGGVVGATRVILRADGMA
ncbi:hypothetical protein ANCCEY_01489 [Ancylostoma ceylanicum]|uniref:Uncharacterized protein n=1 Tax=Ancylostoma ceylanicum TaxID=53326 RepID=A0A0D6M5M6_9BILA|nr:hypothetical protein ANCCEY_01489 [Ancylostoma ceylanicum]